MSAVLVVDRLSKAYRRRPVLRDVSFSVEPGEAFAVVGPNGAGKSTLLGCLTGDRVPDSGSISICGHDPFVDPEPATACTGFVPEQPFLYGELTVAEMLRFVIEARGIGRPEGEAEADRLLRLFGLAGAEGVLCRELSQGMGRKVAITASLLHHPRLLVLDEVFNGLDTASAGKLVAELDRRRANGAAILLSSHDLDLLAAWCQRGLLLAPDDHVALDGDAWERWRQSPTLDRP